MFYRKIRKKTDKQLAQIKKNSYICSIDSESITPSPKRLGGGTSIRQGNNITVLKKVKEPG